MLLGMPDKTDKSTFIAAPLRIPPATPQNARRCLSQVETAITNYEHVTTGERIPFWKAISEWGNANLAAIEGKVGAAGGGAQGTTHG